MNAERDGIESGVATRSIEVCNRYLNLPVATGAEMRRTTISIGGEPVLEFGIELAEGDPDWWAFLDLERFRGKTMTISAHDLPPGSRALEAIHQADSITGSEDLYREARRPQFRFSTRRGWVNDPHLAFHDGEYHLYYQLNPYGCSWGNGHWGHAVSTDLVHWQELPIALYPAPGYRVKSGSVVTDFRNTAGFQSGEAPAVVAMYTIATLAIEDGRIVDGTGNEDSFVQELAFSTDRGRTWTKYAGNPVIPHLVGRNRDPRVFWYEPEEKWVMALYMDDTDYSLVWADESRYSSRFALFSSRDLTSWEWMSDIAIPGDAECPDLFEIALDGDPEDTRWILYAASGTYFLGGFDGTTFTPESGPFAMHEGNCWYAPQTFGDIPASDGRRILIPWAIDRSDAATDPTYAGMPFNWAQGLAVELTLRTTDEGPRIHAYPVRELAALRARRLHSASEQTLSPGTNPLAHVSAELVELEAEVAPGGAASIVLELRGIPLVYDVAQRELSCGDRTARLDLVDGRIRLRILVDRTSVDIFGNDGALYMPMGTVVPPDDTSVGIRAVGGDARIDSLEVFELSSIWG